tara:strand:+ start:855 stop:1046 length:192 start_codon:yes stop_codon:yes gene_type:complete
MSEPQHKKESSKLDYKKLANVYSIESIELQRKLKAANEKIKLLEAANENYKKGHKRAYLASAE